MQHDSGTSEGDRSRAARAERSSFGGIEIDRCVCFDLTFSEVQAQLGGRPTSLDAIARRFGCGTSCGTCRPYLARMLRTGETVFHEIIVDGE